MDRQEAVKDFSMTSWLILDSSFLVYRAQYAMEDDVPAVFGFIATVLAIRERFDSDNMVFCFDSGDLKRKIILPTYKDRKRDPIHEEQHKIAQGVMQSIRHFILPELGFQNILHQQGYEADDIIASVILNSMKPEDDAIIVSSDNDLHQLLSPRVIIYNPTKEEILNEQKFMLKWDGLKPIEWPCVKAIAGCNSDNIKGVRGVGDKTAVKHILGKLPWYSAAAEKIKTMTKEEYNTRLKLVLLPFEGTNTFTLVADEKINWRKVQTYGSKE